MDPFTAIAILAAHLLCTGALFIALMRRVSKHDETLDWALAAFCFGSAFLGRVVRGLAETGALAYASDALMLLASLFFARGLSKIGGRPWSLRTLATSAALVMALHVVVGLIGGTLVRFVSINGLLGFLYLLVAFMAWRPAALGTCHPQQRLPLEISSAMGVILGVASLLRSAHIATYGLDVVYTGPAAAAYFALSSLVAVLLVFALLWVVFERLNGELAQLASLDALTRVLNRNGLQMALRRHFASRPPTPLTLLLIDLDHFKNVNDRHGHAAGDRLIRAVAECLAQVCRGSDFVARFGGEEFLIGCGTDQIGVAEQLAQRVCARVGELRLPLQHGGPLRCTVSIGISDTVYSYADWELASQQADQALYSAKAQGRDRWVRFEGPSDRFAASAAAAN